MSFKVKTQLGLIIILTIFALSLVFSQNSSPNIPPLFALKRIQEKVYLKLKSNPEERLDYMTYLLNNRLDEMRILVNSQSYSYILPTSLRYSTLAGQITDLIISNNLKDKIDATEQIFASHEKVLNDLYVIYPKNIPDNEEWKYIQDDYNYLKIYLDKLSEYAKK